MTWKQRLFLVILWLGFVGLWFRVYYISMPKDITNATIYLTSITLAYGLLVTAWILHNLAIFHRKGPRKNLRFLNHVPTHDELRSYIVAKTDLKATQVITVNVFEGRKLFSDSAAPAAEKELVSA
jgi:hypothetical protein